jgi:DNA processing protein
MILEKGGALISEYPEGTQSFKNQFLERNRIVSGMSIATTVIEAPIHSGALVTAKHAAEQGREVFVLPGASTHPNYEGSHMLIRNGARLVRNTSDIFEDLGMETEKIFSHRSESFPDDLDEEEKTIFRVIDEGREPLWVDKISELTTLKTHIVNRTLTSLILKGIVKEKNGKFSRT